ncbi:MAG: hypothetical protein ACM3VT_06520 [Solirubrobacterales bacterium]
MTNTAEFFHAERRQLSVPAGTAVVFLDGTICEGVEPLEIVRGGWPEFGWARLVWSPSSEEGRCLRPEDIEDRFAFGRRISLHQLYNREPPDAVVASLPLFVGHIESVSTTIDGGEQKVEIVAKDFSSTLQRATVYGRRVLCSDASTVFLPGLDTVFNPLGQANAAVKPAMVGGRLHTIFSPGEAKARTWTCAEAIGYLLGEYAPSDQLGWPDVEQLLALTDREPLRDLDVTGLSLLEALHKCCESAGLTFQFVPRLVETGPAQAIVFSRNGRGRTIELDCQPAGESLSSSRTSIGSFRSERVFYPVTHRYIGQGDFKTYESTFELVKAWDPALEGTSYRIFSASTNPQFHEVKDVYRKWCLNEAGDYSGAPYSQGSAYDFSRLFEHADYVPRHRRFWPALSTDSQGRSLGYFLQVSYDGVNWWNYQHAFSNLLDECGVWLSSDGLDINTWVAALKGLLRVRITASVVSDERLTCTVADGPIGSTAPVVDHVLTLPRRFAYRKVSPQSVFVQNPQAGLSVPDEVDDSVALHQFVRQQAQVRPSVIETAEVQTPTLRLHLHPGDLVTSGPESRDLLGCRRDNRSIVQIERIHVDFRNQCTNLRLACRRMSAG